MAGNNVRLTEEAHAQLAVWIQGTKISMKDAASEAIMLMFKKKQDDRNRSFTTFLLGSIAGGVLMFFIGVMV